MQELQAVDDDAVPGGHGRRPFGGEVGGLLYMGDDTKAFGGHAWNEVVLNGVWVPIDATLNQIDLDAGHISFGEDRIVSGAMLQSLGNQALQSG